jgi:hypothetical protein
MNAIGSEEWRVVAPSQRTILSVDAPAGSPKRKTEAFTSVRDVFDCILTNRLKFWSRREKPNLSPALYKHWPPVSRQVYDIL